MKKFSIAFFVMLLGTAMLNSCSKGSGSPAGGGGTTPPPGTGGGGGGTTCVTTGMKFSTDISPILTSTCSGCHSGSTLNGGVNVGTYAGVKAIADNGKLIGTITHASGFKPMPDGGSKLSDCNIAKIQAWVSAGAPNN
jgi:hypothetical protein